MDVVHRRPSHARANMRHTTRQRAARAVSTRREARLAPCNEPCQHAMHAPHWAGHASSGRSADGERDRRARALGGGDATDGLPSGAIAGSVCMGCSRKRTRPRYPHPMRGGFRRRALEGYLCFGKMEAASRAAACSLKQGSRQAAQASLALARSIAHDSQRPVCKGTTEHVSSRRVEDSTAEGDAYSDDGKDGVSRAEDHGAEGESQVFCAAAENIEGCCR